MREYPRIFKPAAKYEHDLDYMAVIYLDERGGCVHIKKDGKRLYSVVTLNAIDSAEQLVATGHWVECWAQEQSS